MSLESVLLIALGGCLLGLGTAILYFKKIRADFRPAGWDYRNFVELANLGVIVVQNSTIRFCNKTAASWAGMEPVMFLGEKAEKLIRTHLPRLLDETFRMTFHGEVVPAVFPARLIRADDSEMDVEITAGLINFNGGKAILAYIQDITERLILEQAEQRRIRELEALYETMRDISAELEAQRLLSVITQRIIKIMDADFCDLALYDPNHEELEVVVSQHPDQSFLSMRVPLGKFGLGQAAAGGQTLLVEDYSSWSGKSDLVDFFEPKTILFVPLQSKRRLLGALAVGANMNLRKFDHQDIHMVEMFAQQASIAIENAQMFGEIQNLASTDPLTGVRNRRSLMERGQEEFDRSRRYKNPLSMVMIDLDRFKRVNDTYGHLAGDQVLKDVTRICRDYIRSIDILGRYGGEEFILLLPETHKQEAILVAERLRRKVEQMVIISERGVIQVHISLGVAEVTAETASLRDLLDEADKALYRAKAGGRNRVSE